MIKPGNKIFFLLRDLVPGTDIFVMRKILEYGIDMLSFHQRKSIDAADYREFEDARRKTCCERSSN